MEDSNATAIPRRTAITRLGLAAVALGMPVPIIKSRLSSRTDEDVERWMRLSSVPGLTMAVVDGDRVETSAFGVRRAGDVERVTADSVFQAASLTKLVTTYVVLGLVQDGALSLDKPIHEYLPLPNPDDARAQKITGRHLLSHSGGWRNWRNNVTPPLTSDFEPGTRWSYSGEGFFFMQRVAEKLTGKGFSYLARTLVFEPLGMKRSSLVGLAELEPYQVTGHGGRGDVAQVFGRPGLLELRRMMNARGATLDMATVEDSEQALKTAEPTLPVLPNFLNPNGAASMVTTANDYGTFLRHLVTAPREGGRAAAIVQSMLAPQVRCNEAVQWGLGVGLEDVGDRRYAWQWGDNSGFKNFYLFDPAHESAIVVFTNGDRGARVYERVIRARMGVDHPAFLWA